eukprot:3408757-Prymnesium_polylepis.1
MLEIDRWQSAAEKRAPSPAESRDSSLHAFDGDMGPGPGAGGPWGVGRSEQMCGKYLKPYEVGTEATAQRHAR